MSKPTARVIFESIRAIENIDVVKEMVGDVHLPLRLTSDPWAFCQGVTLQPQEAFVISFIHESTQTTDDLIRLGAVDEAVVYKTVGALMHGGVLEYSGNEQITLLLPVNTEPNGSARTLFDEASRATDNSAEFEPQRNTLDEGVKPEELEDPYLGVALANRFRIDTLIGRGGMGAVYRATDMMLGRTVAIKMLRHDVNEDDTLLLRFMREARAAARIAHPNVMTIYDFGFIPEGGTFLVMEYIEGDTLRRLLEQHHALPIAQAIDLMRQLASAVDAAHQAGVIHRDLKPENIILKDIGENRLLAKLIDLGIAKLKESINRAADRITDKTEVLGTPAYMSPEQCVTSKIDEKSDIYSLGVIFYEMLMGDTPFTGSIATVMRKHHHDPVPGLCERRAEIPHVLERLVLLMLSKSKDDRPGLDEVLHCLEETELSVKRPVSPLPSLSLATAVQEQRAKAQTLRKNCSPQRHRDH